MDNSSDYCFVCGKIKLQSESAVQYDENSAKLMLKISASRWQACKPSLISHEALQCTVYTVALHVMYCSFQIWFLNCGHVMIIIRTNAKFPGPSPRFRNTCVFCIQLITTCIFDLSKFVE